MAFEERDATENIITVTGLGHKTIQKKVHECLLALGFSGRKHSIATVSYCGWMTITCTAT